MLGKVYWELFPAAVGTIIHRSFCARLQSMSQWILKTSMLRGTAGFTLKALPAAAGGLSVFDEDVTELNAQPKNFERQAIGWSRR